MKITILTAVVGHKAGQTVTVPKRAGEYLVNAGYAEAVQPDTEAGAKGEGKGQGTSTDGKPAGNASLEDWIDYALAQGKTPEELEGLKREEVKALFTE